MGDVDRSWTGITQEEFIRAVEALPAESRAVFRLRAFGRAYDQIASELQISRDAVGARLRLARTLLRDALVGAVHA
jgi:DNA-directed RNA polymerase specialized sigma24 family protein